MVGLLNGARERILTDGILDASSFDDGIEALRAWKGRPDAAMWFAIAWAEGMKRA